MITSLAFTHIAIFFLIKFVRELDALVPNLPVLFASLLWLKKQAKVRIQLVLLQISGLHVSNLKCLETDGSEKYIPELGWLLCAHLLLNKCGPWWRWSGEKQKHLKTGSRMFISLDGKVLFFLLKKTNNETAGHWRHVISAPNRVRLWLLMKTVLCMSNCWLFGEVPAVIRFQSAVTWSSTKTLNQLLSRFGVGGGGE